MKDYDWAASALKPRASSLCGGVTWKVARIQEVERNEAMCSHLAIRIKERMALNEMKIWTTLV